MPKLLQKSNFNFCKATFYPSCHIPCLEGRNSTSSVIWPVVANQCNTNNELCVLVKTTDNQFLELKIASKNYNRYEQVSVCSWTSREQERLNSLSNFIFMTCSLSFTSVCWLYKQQVSYTNWEEGIQLSCDFTYKEQKFNFYLSHFLLMYIYHIFLFGYYIFWDILNATCQDIIICCHYLRLHTFSPIYQELIQG